MDQVDERIEAFRQIAMESNGDCHRKILIVKEFEDQLGDERVLSFLLNVIGDQSEFDLTRIEALTILKYSKPPNDHFRMRVGRQLAKMLIAERDVLVQQWSAKAAQSFIDLPEVFAVVVDLLNDPSADLDVRHNCLSAVERLNGNACAFGVVEQIANLSILKPL